MDFKSDFKARLRAVEPGISLVYPIDMAQSGDGRFLYSLKNGNKTISAFRVKSDGSLRPLIVVSGIPASAAALGPQLYRQDQLWES